jgi:predicted DNA-binding transcriptional regulator YafY
MFALVAAHKASAQYEGRSVEKTMERGFKKLLVRVGGAKEGKAKKLLNAMSFRRGGMEIVDPGVMMVLAKGLIEGRALKFFWRAPGGQEEECLREVLPYHLACVEHRLYLIGYDVERGEVVRFAVGRIVNPVMTLKSFEVPKDFDVDEFLETNFASDVFEEGGGLCGAGVFNS